MEKEQLINEEMLNEAIAAAQRIRIQEYKERFEARYTRLSETAGDALIIRAILRDEIPSEVIDGDELSELFEEAVETAARFGQETAREKVYVLKKIGDIEEFKSMLYRDVFCGTTFVDKYIRILNRRE